MAAGGGASPGGGAVMEEECEVVRVRVKKSEGQLPPEFRSFAVDPQITSLDVLQHILARAFDLQGKKSFSLSFATRDGQGQDTFVPLLSDSDLGTAFTCARPTLRLRLDVRNPPESPLLEDWDIISPREVAAAEPVPERRSLLAAALPFTQALLAQVGRTLARAQAALAWPEGAPPVVSPPVPAPCAPLGDADLRSYLGPGGRLLRPQELRLHVFHGGVEPGLRKVVWRYLLNVFPAGLSGQERLSHLRRKAAEYAALKAALVARTAPAELAQVGAAVRKDVVRTDRAHPYFGGPEEGHPHLLALQDLLTTFALGHPHLSYCQGMSDVAAPLLAVLDDEAQTYLCFCSLMRRLGPRFRPGGRGLARAFAHLRRLLRRADPPFWAFLAARGAHDLLFCYRWLLLELKREFAFEDALRVLEITWSSLPPAPPPPPTGVPLLGAPLGARGAQRGWRERRGLRPRLPRGRRRRRRRGGEEEEEGGGDGGAPMGGWGGAKTCSGGAGGDRDSQEGPKSSSESPEGPKSSSDIQEGPSDIQRSSKSSSGSPEGPNDTQEGPKSSSESPEGPKSSSDTREGPSDTREGPKSSSESPEGPKSSSDTQEGPSDTQEGPKSSSESPEGDRDIQEGPKSSSESPEGPKSSSESPEAPKSSSDIPEGPKKTQNGPKNPSDTPKGPRGSSDTPKGPKRPRKAPKGAKSPRNGQGAPPKDAEGPDGSKARGPGGPRKVEEGTDALEIDQPPSISRGAGKAPQGSRGSPRGHNVPQEGQEDPKAPERVRGDVPRRAGEEPEVAQDPEGVGGDPSCPWGAGEGPGEGYDELGQHGDPTKRHDEPGKTRGDPKQGHGDPKGGLNDLGQCADPGKRQDDPIEGYDDPKEEHGDLKLGHGDPKFGYDDPKEGYDRGDPKEERDGPTEGHHDPTDGHDPHADDPTAEDPWGGRWAWEDSCSSSSSSSSSSSDEDLAVEDDGAPLPPPEELGQGNPFLLFVCLAMLLEQREAVMARQGDYNEVAMHFDRLVRRHQLPRVLRRAKALFASYLEGWGGTPAAGPP